MNIEEFWLKVTRTDNHWYFGGNAPREKVTLDGMPRLARELVYELEVLKDRPLPPWCTVIATCDIGNCVNPEHLIVCDRSDARRLKKELREKARQEVMEREQERIKHRAKYGYGDPYIPLEEQGFDSWVLR